MSFDDIRILIIRHAEKPDPERGIEGVDEKGSRDPASLSPRGWQRAGALACAFSVAAIADQLSFRPQRIYASRSSAKGKVSRRSIQTVMPLADKLRIAVDTRFGRGDEESLVQDAALGVNPVLISWQREGIPAIVSHLVGDVRPEIPAAWPSDRFDLIWALTRSAKAWSFTQIPQSFLSGDREEPIA